MPSDGLEQLNEQQRLAVQAGDGPLMIIAGPGTGKTKTLTARIAHLVASGRAKPEQILALTFTNKAAEEMSQRVTEQIGSACTILPTIATFHALCHELLNANLTFVTDVQRLQIIKQVQRSAVHRGLSVRELGLLISRAKNMTDIDDEDVKNLVQAYNAGLAERGLHDFDDLLLKTRELLLHDQAARERVRRRFTQILVDEFQDTNRLQYALLQLVRGHENIYVIGDPLQSIYGFRGASGDIFAQFRDDFPLHQAVTLATNYRSAPEIVGVSNALFKEAEDLEAHTAHSGMVRAVRVLNEYSEAHWVVSEIQQAIGGGDFLRAVSDDQRHMHRRLSDFAVLYRSRRVAQTIQKVLGESGLPFQVVGEGSPYDQPRVQAVIALLRAAMNGQLPELEGFPAAQQRLLRDTITDARDAMPHALAAKLLAGLGFESTPDLQQFVNTLSRFKDLAAAVGYFDDIAEQAFYDPSADAITLLTIHASKGLEFPVVFLIGAEQGILPHDRADIDEEKRLFYVAVTRAKERLDIVYTTKRAGHPAQLSAFAVELPDGVLPKIDDPHLADDRRRAQKRQAKRSQQRLF